MVDYGLNVWNRMQSLEGSSEDLLIGDKKYVPEMFSCSNKFNEKM